MDTLGIVILIVAILLIIEAVVMLLKLAVDKMLLLMPLIGVVFSAISFALNEYKDKILHTLSDPALYAMLYVTLAAGVIFGLFGVAVWFKGDREARKLASAAKSIDSAVSGIESDIRGSEMEIEHFDDEMNTTKRKIEDYESREREV